MHSIWISACKNHLNIKNEREIYKAIEQESFKSQGSKLIKFYKSIGSLWLWVKVMSHISLYLIWENGKIFSNIFYSLLQRNFFKLHLMAKKPFFNFFLEESYPYFTASFPPQIPNFTRALVISGWRATITNDSSVYRNSCSTCFIYNIGRSLISCFFDARSQMELS